MDLQTNTTILNRKQMEAMRTNEEKKRQFARWFTRRITTYAVVCTFLAFVNWFTSSHYWWVAWVAAGWGLNLALALVWYLTDCFDENNYKNL